MQWNKKIVLPIAAVACIAIGYASATVVQRLSATAPQPVNVLEAAAAECPGLVWVDSVPPVSRVGALQVEGELYFAGERVPLEDPEVRERLERELLLNAYWHSNTLYSMKLANRYFGEIETILKANEVPTDFKYLALVESGFKNETSPAGATGFWQFVKPTAKSYGLEVNEYIDERYNWEKATEAACKYLKDAKGKLGNWTMAAASYNVGIDGMVSRAAAQRAGSFYDMYFNQETSRYIFRILAMKIIFSNPAKAGFTIRPTDLYQPYRYRTVVVDTPIASIAAFAAGFNQNYKQIKVLNPWLRDTFMPNKERRKYYFKIAEQ